MATRKTFTHIPCEGAVCLQMLGHNLTVVKSHATSGSMLSLEPAWESLPLPLSLPLLSYPLSLSVPLKKKKSFMLKIWSKLHLHREYMKQMGEHETQKLLHVKGNRQQNEKATYPKREKIFANRVSDKGLTSTIYNEFQKLKSRKKKNQTT